MVLAHLMSDKSQVKLTKWQCQVLYLWQDSSGTATRTGESGTMQSKYANVEKPGMKMINLEIITSGSTQQLNPFELLLSDFEEESEASLVRVEDKGSKWQLALQNSS